MIISNRVKQRSTSELQLGRLENGKEVGSSNVLEQRQWEVSADTIFDLLRTRMITYFQEKERVKVRRLCLERNGTAIAELVRANKKTILNDRLSIFNPFIRPTKLLKTLEAVLTTKEKVCFPFLREHIVDLSQKLSLPTRIDCVDLDSSCYSGSSLLYGVKLIVLQEDNISRDEELARDILDVVHVFACRANGKRKYKTRQSEKQTIEEDQESDKKGPE